MGYEDHRGDGLRARPLGDLMGELVREGQGLLREEVRFAKAEIREEARRAAKGGAAMGAGGAVAFAALLLLGIALVLIGDAFLPAWLAALAVTAIYAIVGGALLAKGKRELRRTDPSRAIDNFKEDARWAKETMRDVKSSRDANA
jgi:uncharacterized membrane protein YqjE